MRLVLLAAALALAGCNATMPQQQQQQQQQYRPTAKDDPSVPCLAGIPISPQLATIGSKIPLGDPRKATIEMLASNERPTEVEKAELSLWAKNRAECIAVGRAFRAKHAPPGWVMAMEEGQVAITQAIAVLYGGGTYGAFNSERTRIAMQMASKQQAASQNAKQSAEARQAADRNANLQALQHMQLLQAMQPKPPVPSPTVVCDTTTDFMGGGRTVCK